MTEIVTEQNPPLLQGPSDKEKKYDRQLRLWAANGQAALENANILLVNSESSTVGTETLKNLVLPGIGKFTIVDHAIVTEADLGVNFFLDEDSLGKSRAQCCSELLGELNPDVKGDWFPRKEGENLLDLFQNDPTYTLIIYTFPLEPQTLTFIKDYATQHKIPSIAIHSAGFYSYFTINIPGAFPIVDTHPDTTATTDLRLLSPWPELLSFAKELTLDMEKQSAHDHGHIPYLVLLLHYLEEWKKTHDGKAPSNYGEKKEFSKLVAAGARTDNPEGGEENYDEAVAAVLKNLNPPELSSSVREIFEYKPEESEASSSFWIIADAVKQFHAKHGVLPLPGSVPDMKAVSSVYVKLQSIYKAKAAKDVSEVLETVRSHPKGKDIEEEEVKTFCKNAAFIKLVNGKQSSQSVEAFAEQELTSEFLMSPTLIPIYLALRATSHKSSSTSSDILAQLEKSLPASITSDERVQNAAQEVARSKGAELHNTAALTGGMVAQEIIKVVTKQYIPVENTCVWDGIGSRCQVFRV